MGTKIIATKGRKVRLDTSERSAALLARGTNAAARLAFADGTGLSYDPHVGQVHKGMDNKEKLKLYES